jgi:hypothetical protein
MRLRHHRLLSVLAFGLLALVAELAGRSLTHRFDLGRHVARPSYAHTEYYPFLLIGVKVGLALLLARLAWRFAKARATARTAGRLASAVGGRPHRSAPRVRIELSPRLWACSFLVTAVIFLVQAEAEGFAAGDFASPFRAWIHTSALPVFAVLAVVVAVAWRGVACWLTEYESYAEESAAYVRSLVGGSLPLVLPRAASDDVAPRRLHGLAFESRPPPLPA